MLNAMLRCTLMPKGGNTDRVRSPHYEVLGAILDGVKLNMVEYLVSKMLDCKHNLSSGLAYQPYIMALVKCKAVF